MKESDIIKLLRKKMKIFSVLCLISILHSQTDAETEASCYFPQEFQGEYVMQSTTSSNGIQYSTLNITANAIPIWGNCHRRIGNNFILMINYGETSCIRCLHLKLRSGSVLQVLASSQETIYKCYINKESAEANCPTEESLLSHSAAEIILFKTKDIDGGLTKKEYCPIDGRFYVHYILNDETNKEECKGDDSVLDACPSGSTLNLRLESCIVGKYDIKFDCLGHWNGPDNQTYLALADSRKHHRNQKPQYRCALYKWDPMTGIIHLALSRDSTCTTDLINASYGYETLVLTPKNESAWPPDVAYSSCSFPKWMQGNWEHVRVNDNTLTYKDHSSFKTYTIKCVGIQETGDKYLVFSRTQCDEEHYSCMHIVKRSNNIMEFQLGMNFSTTKNVFELCAESNFEEGSWITQGRLENNIPKPVGMCPISGEYNGLIPDTTDLCAKLWSDCRAPELMYYQVSDCETNEIYEEREYKCLGHWKEDNLLYTYTQRRDVAAGTYECFVGSIIPNKEIYIKEAGEHCQRSIDPLKYGMKLVKQGLYSCIGHYSTVRYETNSKIQTIVSSTTTHLPTKPWNLGIPYPTNPIEIDNNSINSSSTVYVNVICILFFIISTQYF